MLAVQISHRSQPPNAGKSEDRLRNSYTATMDDDEQPPAQRGLKRAHDPDEPIRPIKRLDKKVSFLS